jgi:signal transduction histidine kinase
VRIESVGSAQTVEVRFTDTGIGVRREDLGKLFAPFSQVHDTREVTEPGSGLGLYIAKAIVELHRGAVGAESPGLGQGATFWFRIPKAAPQAVPPGAP